MPCPAARSDEELNCTSGIAMSAEGMPREDKSLLARPLAAATRLVVRFPVAVLTLGVAVSVLAVALAAARLGFKTSRLDLINRHSSFNQLWIDYINEFGAADDVLVVVEGNGREQVVPVLEEVSARLRRENRFFRAVLHEVDLSKIRQKGLYYLNPDDLSAVERFVGEVEPIVRGQWARLSAGAMARAAGGRLQAAARGYSQPAPKQAQAELDRFSESLIDALGPEAVYRSPWPEMPGLVATLSELRTEFLLTNEGRMGFVLLQLVDDHSSRFDRGTEAIDLLRELIAQAQARHPETTIGLTGLPVMENDEMRSSRSATMKASVLSLFGVACLFIAGFGGVRHPLLTVAALLIALGWSLGYITLTVGHLNILSLSFGVILIGLGIDFGIHYVARYLQLRAAGQDCDEAIEAAAAGVGPGIVTGAVTTAIAFFMAGLTEFTGIAELGIISGGGILLCCAAALLLLPAMIHLADRHCVGPVCGEPLDIRGWLAPLFRHPVAVLLVTLAGTLLLALGLGRLYYDYNLLNLQPKGLQSVALEQKLLKQSDQSVWFALSIAATPEELLARKARFEALPSVERVDEIASLIPSDADRKQPIIERIRTRLVDLPERPPQIPLQRPEDLGRLLAEAQATASEAHAVGTAHRLEQARDLLRRMPEPECYRRLSQYQHYVAGDLLSRLYALASMAHPQPPTFSDLPSSLVSRFVGADGKYLLRIFSRGDIWDMQTMEQFVREVRSVDPRVTGNPLQTYEASRQMKRSYQQAAWYALVAILAVLYLDFRSIRHTILAILPLAAAMLQLFGLLGLLGVPLNPANMIVLPLILGIGIDDGVHVVHDFRRCRGRYLISPSTANAVLITSLTTMVGFGSLMIAGHRGLQSLGRVLTLGVTCCLFTSLVMLPALLSWLSRHRADDARAETAAAENGDAEGEPRRILHADHPGRTAQPSTKPRRLAAALEREKKRAA